MMHNRLILVAGLPSGGTSMVAGTLYHLGVDMGSLTLAASGRRNYLGFECETARRDIGGLPADASHETIGQAFEQYLDKRLAEANGKPYGVKLNLLALLGAYSRLEQLPIVVVHVRRDMERAFASDIRYTGEGYARAAWRGMYDLGLRQLVQRVPPACTVQYEDAIANPRQAVNLLKEALRLTVTFRQYETAIEFIDPQGCKCTSSQ